MALLAACTRIPEPDSPGGQVYARRCGTTCHGPYRPESLKFEMWKFLVERMEAEMARRGLPPLEEEERRLLMDYLRKHSG